MNGFPPDDIQGFLAFCCGEWLALRSCFSIDASSEGENGDEWHSSERGELQITYLDPNHPDSLGGLVITPPNGTTQRLIFETEGRFRAGERQGRWLLWPDGSLELVIQDNTAEIREKIWFTKPNLRLRSSVEHRVDGRPGRASFSSEIRRITPPASSAP